MKLLLAVILSFALAPLLVETTQATSGSDFKVRIAPMECTINIIDLGFGPVEQITPAECDQALIAQQLGVLPPNQAARFTQAGRSLSRATQTITIIDQPPTKPEVKPESLSEPTTPPSQEPVQAHVDTITTVGAVGAAGIFADVIIFRGRATRYVVRRIRKLPIKPRRKS